MIWHKKVARGFFISPVRRPAGFAIRHQNDLTFYALRICNPHQSPYYIIEEGIPIIKRYFFQNLTPLLFIRF